MKLYLQLMKARSEFPPIDLDGSVSYSTGKGVKAFKYATLPNIVNKITPVLLKNGIYFTQLLDLSGVRIIIYNEEGETLEGLAPIVYSGANPQDWGSAITYTKRYQLASAFGIVTDEDDDAQRIKEKKASGKPALALNSKLHRTIRKKMEDGGEVTEELLREHYDVSQDVIDDLFPKK